MVSVILNAVTVILNAVKNLLLCERCFTYVQHDEKK